MKKINLSQRIQREHTTSLMMHLLYSSLAKEKTTTPTPITTRRFLRKRLEAQGRLVSLLCCCWLVFVWSHLAVDKKKLESRKNQDIDMVFQSSFWDITKIVSYCTKFSDTTETDFVTNSFYYQTIKQQQQQQLWWFEEFRNQLFIASTWNTQIGNCDCF